MEVKDRDLSVPEMLEALALGEEQADALREQVALLEKVDMVVHHRRGRYRLRTRLRLVAGRLTVPARSREIGSHWGAGGAFGFVGAPGRDGDLFVPSRGLAGARHGDVVLAREIESRRGDKVAGEIIAILEKAPRRFGGKVIEVGGRLRIVPRDDRRASEVDLVVDEPAGPGSGEGRSRRRGAGDQEGGASGADAGGGTEGAPGRKRGESARGVPRGPARPEAHRESGTGGARGGTESARGSRPRAIGESARGVRAGDLVIADMIGSQADRARIVEVIGPAIDSSAPERLIRLEQGLPDAFPGEVEAEADAIARAGIGPGDLEGRTDFRGHDVITIDPADARDFDDAVSLERLDGGNLRLWVHIADVARYVAPGSLLDREALARGTSVYFPGSVIPMIPHALSSGLCSLVEGEDRLVQSVAIEYDRDAVALGARFTDGIIRSTARLSYEEAAAALESPTALDHKGESGAKAARLLAGLGPLARRLTQRRVTRGALDLDLPEVEFDPGKEGAPVALRTRERTEAHRLIEEFMLAANEAVAIELGRLKVPSLHRVHEKPDPGDVLDVEQNLEEIGVHPGRTMNLAGRMQKILTMFRGKPEEAIVSRYVLRAMKLARYSSEPGGHFGLALQHYSHFTSPIRRYPDLIVHRVLRATRHRAGGSGSAGAVVPGGHRYRREELEPVAVESSRLERRAEEAERTVNDLMVAHLLLPMVGREFSGRVSGKIRAGIFVALEGQGLAPGAAEGFVPLPGKRSFALTEQVKVRLEEVDLLRGRVRLALSGD
jgi:ribonuclease R